MKLKEILNIPGMSGLYKMVAQIKSGLIVESLADGKRQPIAANHRVVPLSDIRIYTSGEEMPLVEVFKKMEAEGANGVAVDSKADEDALQKYFKKLVPDIDEEKVHASHLKKIITWYELLKGKVDFNAKEEEGDEKDSPDEKDRARAGAHVNDRLPRQGVGPGRHRAWCRAHDSSARW